MQRAGVGLDDVAVTIGADTRYPHAEPHRDLEPLGVGLEVVGHVVLAGERPRLGRERHARQAVVLGGGVEAEAVPLLPPPVADALVAVQDDAVAALLLQVVRRRQAGLPGADDDGLDVVHDSSWRRFVIGGATLGRGGAGSRRAGCPFVAGDPWVE